MKQKKVENDQAYCTFDAKLHSSDLAMIYMILLRPKKHPKKCFFSKKLNTKGFIDRDIKQIQDKQDRFTTYFMTCGTGSLRWLGGRC